jgi:two-component system sensor histidine kinase UhpB
MRNTGDAASRCLRYALAALAQSYARGHFLTATICKYLLVARGERVRAKAGGDTNAMAYAFFTTSLAPLSLKLRFNLLITAILLLSMGLGGVLIIENNRRAVRNEIEASTELTLGLLDATTDNLHFSAAQGPEFRQRLAAYVAALSPIRHVRLQVLDSSGRPLVKTPVGTQGRSARAPAWFVRLVAPKPIVYRKPIRADGAPYGFVVVSTHPADEMAEDWLNVRDLFGVAAALFVLTWILVVWSVGRALKPVEILLRSFGHLERGDFHTRLPEFGAPELALISRKFNRMAQTLEQTARENQKLTQRLIMLQDEERRTVARELHDDLGQYLFAVKSDAFAIAQLATENKAAKIGEKAHAICALASQMETIVRKMIQRLRPLVLDELGLADALRDLTVSWRTHHPQIACMLEISGSLDDLGKEIDTAVYHMVQECLTNIAKHADASRVEIAIRRGAREMDGNPAHNSNLVAQQTSPGCNQLLLVRVSDNGRGIQGTARSGMGLIGMRERIEALGGRLEIAPGLEAGSCVTAAIPLDKSREGIRS